MVPLYHSNNDCVHVEHFLNEYGAPYVLERKVCGSDSRCAGQVKLAGRLNADIGALKSGQREFLKQGLGKGDSLFAGVTRKLYQEVTGR